MSNTDDIMPVTESGVHIVVDVYETADAVIVQTAPIDGDLRRTLDVSVTGQTLTIAGTAFPHVEVQADAYLQRERVFGAFSRNVPLPGDVDADAAEATLRRGVLTVTLPKTGGSDNIVDVQLTGEES